MSAYNTLSGGDLVPPPAQGTRMGKPRRNGRTLLDVRRKYKKSKDSTIVCDYGTCNEPAKYIVRFRNAIGRPTAESYPYCEYHAKKVTENCPRGDFIEGPVAQLNQKHLPHHTKSIPWMQVLRDFDALELWKLGGANLLAYCIGPTRYRGDNQQTTDERRLRNEGWELDHRAPTPRKGMKGLPQESKAGFTGRKRDSLGRNTCYQNGVHVPCSGVDSKPQPKPPALKGYTPHHEKLVKIVGKAKGAVREDTAFATRTIRNLPDSIARYVASKLKSIYFVASTTAMAKAYEKNGGIFQGDDLLGFCTKDGKVVFVAAGERDVQKVSVRDYQSSTTTKISGTLQHELGHVLDNCATEAMLTIQQKMDLEDPKKWYAQMDQHRRIFSFPSGVTGQLSRFSSTEMWIAAWQKDIVDAHQIGDYAAWLPHEGFAEFHRLVCQFREHGKRMNAVEKAFPNCVKAWKEFGIWE